MPGRNQVIPAEAIEDTAYISTAFIGICASCDERSSYALAYAELEGWVAAHNAAEHGVPG